MDITVSQSGYSTMYYKMQQRLTLTNTLMSYPTLKINLSNFRETKELVNNIVMITLTTRKKRFRLF